MSLNKTCFKLDTYFNLNTAGDNPDFIRAMAEPNGDVKLIEHSLDDDSVEKAEYYPKLTDYGLDKKVASKLGEIYQSGKLAPADLDERALYALKELPVEGAINVLTQFFESNLEYVSNKSAYLYGVVKTYWQKSRRGGITGPDSVGNTTPASTLAKGPDEEKIKVILERTGYTLDVTIGQRKYGGPPPKWDGPSPGPGCEVFAVIPNDMFEDELILLFENSGTIWDIRLMMDPMTGTNRGYAFITYTTKDEAQQATKDLDNYEIKPGKHLKVNIIVPNLRLFVGNIPKTKAKEEIMEEFSKFTAGLTEVIIYSSPDSKKKNRGFCFLEFESHKAASFAKRRLGTGRVKVWGCDIKVDWADPQDEPDSETMAAIKVVYVRNLTQECSEEKLKEAFEVFGKVDQVKKIRSFAYIHFDERDHAVKAMNELNGKDIGGSCIEVSLAKPPCDKKKKKEIIRARKRRMMQMNESSPQHPSMIGLLPYGGPMPRDYDHGYYGYGDYRSGYTDPYHDDYCGYEDCYRGYEDCYRNYTLAVPPAREMAWPAQPGITEAVMERGTANTGLNSGAQCERGRGTVGRGRAGGPQSRGVVATEVSSSNYRFLQPQLRGAQTQDAPHRGHPFNHQPSRGCHRAVQSLLGKRKLDEGNQNQEESKHRYQGSWGNQPHVPQPLGNTYGINRWDYNLTGDQQWSQDSYNRWS